MQTQVLSNQDDLMMHMSNIDASGYASEPTSMGLNRIRTTGITFVPVIHGKFRIRMRQIKILARQNAVETPLAIEANAVTLSIARKPMLAPRRTVIYQEFFDVVGSVRR